MAMTSNSGAVAVPTPGLHRRSGTLGVPFLLAQSIVNFFKVLEHLSRPWTQAWLLVLVGVLLLCWRRWRVGGTLLLSGVAWLWLCATPAFALLLQRRLIEQYPTLAAAAYPKADAIVVLGGGVIPSASLDWDSDVADTDATRVGFGLLLFKAGRAPDVLLSGGHDAALQMASKLRQQGVPAGALQTEQASASTYQNALYSAAMLKRDGQRRILLVTSPMHMPRAVASFRRQGLNVIAAPSIGSDRPVRVMNGSDWPQPAALFLTARCLHEYVGLWVYRLRGWA
jgi:uncharacterized SAM-binding protein YcdF (DUF218 family)